MKEEIAKIYAEGLYNDLPPNVFADQVLRLFIVRLSLLTELDLERLQMIADAYLYEGVNNDLHIGRKGIPRILEEWLKMLDSNDA